MLENKKIRAYYDNEKKRIVIDDNDVKKGDYIDIYDGSISEQLLDSLFKDDVKKRAILEYKDSEEYKDELEKYKNNISNLENEKTKISKELFEANTKINSFNKTLETEKENALLKFKQNEYRTLLESFNNLEKDFEVAKIKAIDEYKDSEEYKNTLKDYDQKVNNLKNEKENINNKLIEANTKISNFEETLKIEKENALLKFKQNEYRTLLESFNNLEKDFEVAKINAVNEFKESDDYKKLLYSSIRRINSNSKVLGEDFEKECYEIYNNDFQQINNVSFERTNKTISGRKPDFLFTVYTNEDKKYKIASVVLEMKTNNSETITKNETYFESLDKNRVNFDAEFGLLVTELELNQENDFAIKKVAGYPRLFMVRPQYFTYILILFKVIYEKSSNMIDLINKENIDKKEVINFIDEFTNFKEDLFTKTIKNVEGNIEEIITQSEKIKKSADKILESISTIKYAHLETVKNKIESYVKKITRTKNVLE